jgi:hypothetical protein
MQTTRTKVKGVEVFYYPDGTTESRITTYTLNNEIWFVGTAAVEEGHDISVTGTRTKLIKFLMKRHPKLFAATTANAVLASPRKLVAKEILAIVKPRMLDQPVIKAKQIEDLTAKVTYTRPYT